MLIVSLSRTVIGVLGDCSGLPVDLLENGQQGEDCLVVVVSVMPGQMELQGEGGKEMQWGKGYRDLWWLWRLCKLAGRGRGRGRPADVSSEK